MDQEPMAIQTVEPAPLACPHCGSGRDLKVVGLFWDIDEKSWRCLTCGHRTFERRYKTQAQLQEDAVWDAVLASFEPAEAPPADGETEWSEAV
jgi:transposase-like protein